LPNSVEDSCPMPCQTHMLQTPFKTSLHVTTSSGIFIEGRDAINWCRLFWSSDNFTRKRLSIWSSTRSYGDWLVRDPMDISNGPKGVGFWGTTNTDIISYNSELPIKQLKA
jgi:hypothetical protein